MQPPRESALSLILIACSLLAVSLAVAFAWALRNFSLAGFFLAIAIAAAAFATIFWPERPRR